MNGGQYLIVYPREYEIRELRARMQLNRAVANLNSFAFNIAFAGAAGGLVGVSAGISAIGISATLATPSLPQPIPIYFQQIPQVGLPKTTVYGVQIDPDRVNSLRTTYSPPPELPGATAPVITDAEVVFADYAGAKVAQVALRGRNFLAASAGQPAPNPGDLVVLFKMPVGEPIAVQASYDSGTGTLNAVVPDSVTLGIAEIKVARPDKVRVPSRGPDPFKIVTRFTNSNPVRIDAQGKYVFVALPEAKYHGNSIEGAVAVIDGNPESSSFNELVAKIPVGQSQRYPLPRNVAVTPDNTRVYVTLRGANRIAVVDALTLQEVNVNARKAVAPTSSSTPIPAPQGIALDPALNLTQLVQATDIRGTIDFPRLKSWSLELRTSALPLPFPRPSRPAARWFAAAR